MRHKKKLPLTEELDFAYLLELMMPLKDVEEYSWLPELFSIIGHQELITLCKYAGGEIIRIPTIQELTESIEALQWFYDVEIKLSRKREEVPDNLEELYNKIHEVYHARLSEEVNEGFGSATRISTIFSSVHNDNSG